MATIKGWGWAPARVYGHEKAKAYPDRFPLNKDSVGIETVADHDGVSWEIPTAEQAESIGTIVKILQGEYGLTDPDIHEHDKISYKTPGEGAGLYSPTPAPEPPPIVQPRFPGHDDGGAQVKVENARYTGKTGGELEAACLDWSLTPEQVRTFFDLGRRYKENPYSEFYQLPCIISGRILAEDRIWHFEINGGGTATWSSDGQTRYWGCRAERCGSLVLLLSDGMSGD